MEAQARVSRGRRVISCQLSPVEDADLLPWVEELLATGQLSRAIRQGLRLLLYVEQTPGARAVWQRGLIMQALEEGLLGPQARGHAAPAGRGAASPEAPAPGTAAGWAAPGRAGAPPGPAPAPPGPPAAEANLDRALGSF